MEAKMREESKQVLDEKEQAKKDELDRLKRQLQRKYKDDLSSIKSEESNSNELKKILKERNNQYKELSEGHNKLKA